MFDTCASGRTGEGAYGGLLKLNGSRRGRMPRRQILTSVVQFLAATEDRLGQYGINDVTRRAGARQYLSCLCLFLEK
ncbi:hypothetical protein FHX15_002930 [Rhizobium sp. BK650]|nr:hypothetical protein [Rhizobium sp. BK650]